MTVCYQEQDGSIGIQCVCWFHSLGQRVVCTDCLVLTSLDVNVYRRQCLIHLIVRLARDQLMTQILQNKGVVNRN